MQFLSIFLLCSRVSSSCLTCLKYYFQVGLPTALHPEFHCLILKWACEIDYRQWGIMRLSLCVKGTLYYHEVWTWENRNLGLLKTAMWNLRMKVTKQTAESYWTCFWMWPYLNQAPKLDSSITGGTKFSFLPFALGFPTYNRKCSKQHITAAEQMLQWQWEYVTKDPSLAWPVKEEKLPTGSNI